MFFRHGAGHPTNHDARTKSMKKHERSDEVAIRFLEVGPGSFLGQEDPAVTAGRAYKPLRSGNMCRTGKSSSCRCRLTEGLNGRSLVVHDDVEDGRQFRDLQNLVDFVRWVEQLQFSIVHAHSDATTD